MSEIDLQRNILNELTFEPRVNAAHIGVSVDKGIVTLNGHVCSYAEKLAAVLATRRINGVRAVADDIEVRFPGEQKTADDEIAERAVDILAWDHTLPTGSIQVTVRNGMVALSGSVDWYYQRVSAEENVQKLSGVTGIANGIIIGPRIKPEDVKRKIEDALKRSAEVEAKGIRVTVHDGNRVLLEGKVHNWNERYAVENAAWSVGGVQAVEDRLVIA